MRKLLIILALIISIDGLAQIPGIGIKARAGNSFPYVMGNGQYVVYTSSGSVVRVSSDYASTWATAGSNVQHRGLSISTNAQYQLSALNASYLYRSTDYGATFNYVTGAGNRNWASVAVSGNGQYQTAGVNGGYLYRSTDYGASWSQVTGSAQLNYRDICMDYTGQYQYLVEYSYITGRNGNILKSSDYGATWSDAIINIGELWRMDCSRDGKYITVGVYYGRIYRSGDYGATWSQVGPSSSLYWFGIGVSSTGQYQVAYVQSGKVYYSTNYGVTWNESSIGSGSWSGITINGSGNRIYAVNSTGNVYLSTDYGATFSYVSKPHTSVIGFKTNK